MKKHAHLLAILAVLLLCIGTVLWMKFGPTESGGGPEDTGAGDGCSGIETHKATLLKEKAAYEVIESYLRQKFDAGTIPAGKVIPIDNLANPTKADGSVLQQFYDDSLPQEVLNALDGLGYGEVLGDDHQPRRYYIQRMTLYPEFTLVVFHPSHSHDYILFTAEGEPDKAAFLAAYPQYSDVTFTPVEGRWYISETTVKPLPGNQYSYNNGELTKIG